MSTIIIFVVISVGFFILWLNENRKNSFKLPGPSLVPLLGNAFDFRLTTRILPTLTKYSKSYGDVVNIRIGTKKFILISNYKLLEHIFTGSKFLKKSDNYRFFLPWLGTGLLTSDGIKWKKHRRILTPAFHFQILEQFIDIFDSCSDHLVDNFKNSLNSKSINIYPFVTLCTLDIICETIMGTNIKAQDNDESDYVQSVKEICRVITERSLSPIEMFDIFFPFTKNYSTEKKALKILHNHTNSVINKRRKELEATNKCSLIKTKKLFLDLLLEAKVDGETLSHEEIREQVDTFMFEGHDTTASAISFALFCLANNPNVQKKVFDEQLEIVGSTKNISVTYADLQNMKFLELVIKETLRLYPSVPIIGRQTTEDINYGNIKLPKGDTLLIFIYGIHRNPNFFTNPEEFNPSRFENFNGRTPYAYIPFSAGARNCIGQKFAMLEMKSTISKIIRNFELLPAYPQHKLRLAVETVLKSINGINIGLKLRD